MLGPLEIKEIKFYEWKGRNLVEMKNVKDSEKYRLYRTNE